MKSVARARMSSIWGWAIRPIHRPGLSLSTNWSEAAHDPKNHGYSEARGILNLRREVASKYLKNFGVRLDPENEVIACLGSKDGFSHLCLALLGPGDSAIVPAPSYPAHTLRGRAWRRQTRFFWKWPTAEIVPLGERIDETCHKSHPRPKVVIVNYPHNPSTATTVEPEILPRPSQDGQKVRFHGHKRP